MKKVLGVAVAASLVAGMAFADVSVTLNGRMRSNMYHYKETDAGTKTVNLYNLDDGTTKHAGSGSMSDTLAFDAKTDYAGVHLEMAPVAGNDAPKVDNTYNAFVKFGDLKLTYGQLDSRFVNRYNVTAGESGLLDSDDIAKYGTALLSGSYAGAKDSNNFSALNGTKVVDLIADYTFADVAGGKLLVKAALQKNAYKTEVSGDKTTNTKAGYAFEADFQNDAANVQVLFKAPKDKQTLFGIFAEAKGLPVKAAAGFTYAQDKNDGTAKGNIMVIDGRLGYKVNDAMNIASVIKYERGKADAQDDADTALTLAAEVSYIVNEKVTAFVDAGYYNADLDSEKGLIQKDCVIKVRPGVVATAGKNARVTAAFQYDNHTKRTDNTGTKTEYSIPVIFRVKM